MASNKIPVLVNISADQVIELLKERGTLVEVVRCRECKYAHLTYDGDAKYCDLLASKDKYGDCDPFFYRSGDWFCADGEREVQE